MRPLLGADVTSDALLTAGLSAGPCLCVITGDKELSMWCLFVLIALIAMIVMHMVSTAYNLNINAPLIGTTVM